MRRRGTNPERLKQLAWLGYVGVVTVFWILLGTGALVSPGGNSSLGTVLWVVMILTPVIGIPVACAVAVLKYRLYDIDRLISRTVSYAVVTGLLVGLYAMPQVVSRTGGKPASAASTSPSTLRSYVPGPVTGIVATTAQLTRASVASAAGARLHC